MNENIARVLRGILSDLSDCLEQDDDTVIIPIEDYYHAMGALDTLYTLVNEMKHENNQDS